MGFMLVLMIIIHIVLSVALIAAVLMQSDKGDGLAGAFGGGGGATNSVFGSRGPASMLAKMTTILAILFVCSSIGITYFTANQAQGEDAARALDKNIGSAAGVEMNLPEVPTTPETGE